MKIRNLSVAICGALAMCFGSAYAQTCPGLAVSVQQFTPTGGASMSVNGTAAAIALPTNSTSTPAATSVVVSNPGVYPAYVQLGDSSVVADTTNGFQVLPGASVVLAIHSNTYLSAVAGGNVPLHISTGY